MAKNTNDPDLHGGRMRVPRSRGAVSGILLIVLGAWGALIPFVGPAFNFGYTPNSSFDLTLGRFWLELLPGVVAAVGGLLLLVAANRVVTSFGAWLAVAGGAWFVVGPALDRLLHLGGIGTPLHSSTLGSTLENLLLFDGIGALILFLGAVAVGRLGVVSVRDVKAAQRRERQKDDDDRNARDSRIEARHSAKDQDDDHRRPTDDDHRGGFFGDRPTAPTPRGTGDADRR